MIIQNEEFKKEISALEEHIEDIEKDKILLVNKVVFLEN